MVSDQHEAMVEIFRQSPSFVTELFTNSFGTKLPETDELVIGDPGFNEPAPTKATADLVLLLRKGQETMATIIVEIQRAVDKRKEVTWPLYALRARQRHQCPAELLVVTQDSKVEAWAEKPRIVDLSGSHRWQPKVIGPSLLSAPSGSEMPQWSVLRAIAFGEGNFASIQEALERLKDLDERQQSIYHDLLRKLLGEDTWRNFEMAYQYPQSDFAKKHYQDGRIEGQAEGRVEGRVEGRAEGQASLLQAQLEAKFGSVGPDFVAKLGSASQQQLQTWGLRIFSAETLEAVFEDA